MEVIPGKKYWTCSTSIESSDDCSIRKPWLGIVSRVSDRNCYIHSFDENDKIDFDTNATAVVKLSKVFDNEADAWQFYRERCKTLAMKFKEEYEYYLQESNG